MGFGAEEVFRRADMHPDALHAVPEKPALRDELVPDKIGGESALRPIGKERWLNDLNAGKHMRHSLVGTAAGERALPVHIEIAAPDKADGGGRVRDHQKRVHAGGVEGVHEVAQIVTCAFRPDAIGIEGDDGIIAQKRLAQARPSR